MPFDTSFFVWNVNVADALQQSYNVALVLLSYLVASVAGFCALSINYFMAVDKYSNHPLLKLVGGSALGLGIWTMHFIGMKALTLPVPVKYDVTLTVISIIPAVLASIAALHITSKPNLTKTTLVLTALILASGIATMHFTGMAAMSMQAYMVHDPIIFALSILASWGLACLTLFIQFDQLPAITARLSKNAQVITGALAFGFAVATMHYLALQSCFFMPIKEPVELSGIGGSFLTYSLLVTLVILICTLTLILFYKRKIQLLVDLASTNHRYMVETIDNMEDPFMLCDEHGKILLINHAYLSEFSVTQEQLADSATLDQTLKQLLETSFLFDSNNDVQTSIENLRQAKQVRLSRKDGTWWLLRQTKTKSKSVIQTWTDITEQHKAELAIIEARNTAQNSLIELQRTQDELVETKKMASLGGLVTSVAHELNTPLGIAITSLSSIKSNVKELQEMVSNNKLTKQSLVTAIEQIDGFESLADKNLDRTNSIIQQFKFISMDQQSEDPIIFRLYESIRHVQTAIQDTLIENNVTIDNQIPEDFEVFTCQEALYQVLRAIILNSATHGSESKGAVHITTKIELIDDGHFRLIISDDGKGVAADIHKTVFDPFVTTKRTEGHIGLGLHVAFNFVTLKLGGKIELAQSNQDGTSIQIDLPIQICQDSADLIDSLGV